jgi:hypothetical protein
MMEEGLLNHAKNRAVAYLASLPARNVGATVSRAELLSALGTPLAEEGADGFAVLEQLADGADRGLVASAGGRYFGFVNGACLPAALAADREA